MIIMSAATCTLAIVMFRTLGRVDIPGGLHHNDAVRDKATYREIYDAARTMEEQCVEQGTYPANVGWAVVGKCHQVVESGVTDWCRREKECRGVLVGDGFDDKLSCSHGTVLSYFDSEWVRDADCGGVIEKACVEIYIVWKFGSLASLQRS